MKLAIEKFIENNKNGLFLLDSPTGFGKTFAVKKILKEFLSGKKHQNIDKMFYVTNLKKNLPYDELLETLSDEEKKQCFIARSYDEAVVQNWQNATITSQEVTASSEYKKLKNDMEVLRALEDEIRLKKIKKKIGDRCKKV